MSLITETKRSSKNITKDILAREVSEVNFNLSRTPTSLISEHFCKLGRSGVSEDEGAPPARVLIPLTVTSTRQRKGLGRRTPGRHSGRRTSSRESQNDPISSFGAPTTDVSRPVSLSGPFHWPPPLTRVRPWTGWSDSRFVYLSTHETGNVGGRDAGDDTGKDETQAVVLESGVGVQVDHSAPLRQ